MTRGTRVVILFVLFFYVLIDLFCQHGILLRKFCQWLLLGSHDLPTSRLIRVYAVYNFVDYYKFSLSVWSGPGALRPSCGMAGQMRNANMLSYPSASRRDRFYETLSSLTLTSKNSILVSEWRRSTRILGWIQLARVWYCFKDSRPPNQIPQISSQNCKYAKGAVVHLSCSSVSHFPKYVQCACIRNFSPV